MGLENHTLLQRACVTVSVTGRASNVGTLQLLDVASFVVATATATAGSDWIRRATNIGYARRSGLGNIHRISKITQNHIG